VGKGIVSAGFGNPREAQFETKDVALSNKSFRGDALDQPIKPDGYRDHSLLGVDASNVA
jgi:hypothetical protein